MKKRTVRPNTVRNYTERYEHNIDPVIGKLILSEGKTDSMPDGYEPDDRRRISYNYYLSGKDTPPPCTPRVTLFNTTEDEKHKEIEMIAASLKMV